MKIITTTIRHEQSSVQLAEFIEKCKDERVKKRYNPEQLLKSGYSRAVIKENGATIETIVKIEKD